MPDRSPLLHRDSHAATEPSVAILLSTYNGVRFLKQQLDSILEQSHTEWTLFVRDDGSSDETLRILDNYVRRDPRIVVTAGENVGVVRSFFQLMKGVNAGYGFYAFCDQDDIWRPDKLRRAIDVLSDVEPDRICMYCTRQEYVDANRQSIGFSKIPRRLEFYNALVENVATGCTVVFNRAAREQLVRSLPQCAIMHDWWVYLVVSCFGSVHFDDYASIEYRQHEHNQVGASASPVERFLKRLMRHMNGQAAKSRLSHQARLFDEAFGDEIEERYREEINRLLVSKRNILTRCHYALTTRLRRNAWLDSVLFRFLVVLGRY